MASGVGGSRRHWEPGRPLAGITGPTYQIPILLVLQPQKKSVFPQCFPEDPWEPVLWDTLYSSLIGLESCTFSQNSHTANGMEFAECPSLKDVTLTWSQMWGLHPHQGTHLGLVSAHESAGMLAGQAQNAGGWQLP